MSSNLLVTGDIVEFDEVFVNANLTEAEKDAWIVQLRSDVVKYRDAYRLTKYQLDAALKEIKELKEKNG